MNAEPLRLVEEVIASVADGQPVDWDAISASTDPREQRLIQHLRLIAGVAEVHRTMVVDEPHPTTGWSDAPEADSAQTGWGHLLLIEKIGEGAFGEVYRARDPWLDRDVALKLLKPEVATRVPASRLINEARSLARLRHPNVVTVYGADVHDERAGLWMELVRGRTLEQILRAQGSFSANEAAVIGQDVCRALAAVHAAGLVHQDVKAQNVMRESGGRIVVMDLGTGGTPIYLAPEVLSGAGASTSSDLYAVGVLLFHLVTGRYPVSGTSPAEIVLAHERGDRKRLSDLRADLPDEFVGLVERALRPAPGERFTSAGEMLDALTRFSPGPASSRTAVSPSATRPLWRRSRTALVTATVGVLALVAALVWSGLAPSAPSSDEIHLIAVLPLRSEDPQTEYFADGMTEALQQGLAGISALRVVSRTSVERARESAATLPEIGQLLGADAILEGSINRANERVRVNLRLIHAGSDTPVWSRSFEETLGEVFALQSQVANAVAAEMVAAVAPQTGPRPPIDPEAYDEYLRGRYEYRRQTQVGVETALAHFQRAVALEPGYARAFAGIAECYLYLGGAFAALPESESARLARDAVTRAIRLDETLAEAYAMRAAILFEFDWNFGEAEKEFLKAIELDPSLVASRREFASFLTSRGRFDEAFQQLAAARAVDPLSATVADATAAAHYFARQFEEAVKQAHRAIKLEPSSMSPRVGLARILNAMGRHRDAIEQYELVASQSGPIHPFFQSEIAQAELALGQRTVARERVGELESQISTPGSRVVPYMLALMYARLDVDTAFKWLDEEFQRRSARVLWLLVDPRVDPLRSDPRFGQYLRQLSLP